MTFLNNVWCIHIGLSTLVVLRYICTKVKKERWESGLMAIHGCLGLLFGVSAYVVYMQRWSFLHPVIQLLALFFIVSIPFTAALIVSRVHRDINWCLGRRLLKILHVSTVSIYVIGMFRPNVWSTGVNAIVCSFLLHYAVAIYLFFRS